MQSVRSKDTGPELALRRALWKAGLRYRLHAKPDVTLRRRADLVFFRERVAVFVDGCFWHGCPIHRSWPKANSAWWRQKIEYNMARDVDTTARLEAAGWTVIRIWSHEPIDEAVAKVRAALSELRPVSGGGISERDVFPPPKSRVRVARRRTSSDRDGGKKS